MQANAFAANPTCAVLRDLGTLLPARPMDLSAAVAAAGVTCSYVIVMTGRSGSTWLATALRQVPGAGYPQEYFSNDALPHYGRNQPEQSLADFLTDMVARHSSRGTFGFKIDPLRLSWLETVVATVPTFGGPAGVWIDMRRWDLVKQAFSFARAKRSGLWHVYADDAERVDHVAVPDGEVWQNIGMILRNEQWIDAFYANKRLRPLRLMYEELHESRLHLLRRVLQAIDPDRAWDSVSGVLDGTAKLAGAREAADELDFLSRNIGLVSRIMAERATFNYEVLLTPG